MTLIDYLKLKNIKQTQLCKEMNVPTITMFRWVHGYAIPRLKHMQKINKLSKGLVSANDFYLTDKTKSKKNKNKKQSTGG